MKILIAACAGLLILSACDRNTGSSSTPSTPAAQQGTPAPTAPMAADNAAQNEAITWQLPPGWTQQEGSGMRMSTISPGNGVEVAVTALGGEAGGVLPNVNRWRGQLGLEPIAEADIEKNTEKIPLASGGQVILADIVGPNPDSQRMLAAIVPGKDRTYFFKATAARDKIEQIKPGFIALLKSVKVQ